MSRLWPLMAHWKTPAVILVAYLAALTFAIGHHFFYHSLNGQDVEKHYFGQETTVAIGTAFAFLVRATLVIAVGTVYWQMFWLRLGRQSFAITEVDSLAGALTSVLDLVDVRALRRSPDLGIIALLAWLLPFAAVFPPATLSVHSALVESTKRAHVAIPYLSGDAMAMTTTSIFMNLSQPSSSPSFTDQINYSKPSLKLTRLAMATATHGSILDSLALYSNSSYIISFEAPAVQCQHVASEILDPFIKASGCDFLSGKEPEEIENNSSQLDYCWDLWYYVSWVPGSGSLVPFEANSIHDSSQPLEDAIANVDGGYTRSPFFGSFEGGAMSIYVATRDLRLSQTTGSWNVLHCSLHNATYFVNMTSDTDRRNVPSLLNVSLLGEITDFLASPESAPPVEPGSAIDASAKATLNHMAIMVSMGAIFLGTIFGPDSAPFDTDFPYPFSTSDIVVQPTYLMQSMLPFTPELLPMLSKTFRPEEFVDNQWSVIDDVRTDNFTVAVPASATGASTFNLPLGAAIEQLFHNLSMSFLSDPAFVKDSDEEVLITLRRTRNIYSYRYKNLLLSYGVALALSLLACIVGWMSIINNNASYSNRFSTVLRVLSGGNVTGFVAPEDCKGRDPLPKYLAKARIDLSQGTRVQEGDGGSEVELHQIFERLSETSSGKNLVQELREDVTEPQQQQLMGSGEMSRRTSYENSRDSVEAQVHHLPETILGLNPSVEASAIESEGRSHH